MTKLMITLAAARPSPAVRRASGASVRAGRQSTSEIIVYGNDPCPRSTDDQSSSAPAGRRAERYRLPEDQQRRARAQQTRVLGAASSQALTTVGATGTGSCSPVGPGGYTGCLDPGDQQASAEASASSRPSRQSPPQ